MDEVQQATPVNPDETSTIPTDTQRETDVHRSETGYINPQSPAAPQRIERQRGHASIDTVDRDNRMDTMENMATDNTRAGLAERRGEDSQLHDMLPEALQRNQNTEEQCTKRECGEDTTADDEAKSTKNDTGQTTEDMPGSPKDKV